MFRRVFLSLLIVCSSVLLFAQYEEPCGAQFIKHALSKKNAAFGNFPLKALNYTSSNPVLYPIPIVVHIVLNTGQLASIGTEKTLATLIDSMVISINRDFNARNSDSVNIPTAFATLYGNANIQFALAHTTPSGMPSPGFEIKTIDPPGFNIDGTAGSGIGFSDAKYSNANGLNTWDAATYLNIWVINPLERGQKSNFLGLTIPPEIISQYGLPTEEAGIVLNYSVFKNQLRFRTVTHELGHFFGLNHIWGDDSGKCIYNGGNDDDIADTPPQASETYGCPVFPRKDNCSPVEPGILFMNFMDYTDDACKLLFTKMQAKKMYAEVMPGGISYSLTQHPSVLDYNSGLSSGVSFYMYPNPVTDILNIKFDVSSQDLEHIEITNSLGMHVFSTIIMQQQGFYTYNMTKYAAGLYFIRLKFKHAIVTERIYVSK